MLCELPGYSRQVLDDCDKEAAVSLARPARLRCGMIVLLCRRHPTRATGNHADRMELSVSATEVNTAKL